MRRRERESEFLGVVGGGVLGMMKRKKQDVILLIYIYIYFPHHFYLPFPSPSYVRSCSVEDAPHGRKGEKDGGRGR